MEWNFETELISLVLLGIIWFYSRGNNKVFTLRNRIFQSSYYVVFLSTTVNVLYLLDLSYHFFFSPALLLAAQSFHHVITPAGSVLCALYTLAYIYEKNGRSIKRNLILFQLPYAVYLIFIFLNLFTGVLYSVTAAGQFVHGPFYPLIYGIYYVYAILMVGTILLNRRVIVPAAVRILLLFPLIIIGVTLVQTVFPTVVLGGFASVCILLIAYLYLQNKRIWEDQLTGLPNRTAYLQMLNWRIERKQPMVVMIISLNDYKFINDKFGQANGDLLLKEIASFLQSVVSRKEVYRFGGDKFAVIFHENKIDTALDDINRIAERFQHIWEIPGNVCHISAAIGAAQYPASAETSGELVSMLESAVERAKFSGSTQPIFCDLEIISQVRRKHALYEMLRAALQDGRVEVYYQPLYSIAHDRFTEAEALVRVRDESGKFLSPEEFVPIAEETGLIIDIGYVVLKRVCEYIRNLLQRGIQIETISVNLSVAQLIKTDFVPRALQIIHANGISPNRIIFEITESILVSNYEMISEKTKQLSDEGIRFALDDFGTGYSNLSHVIDLPFNVVKIDKSLIWDSMSNSKCYVMVRDMSKIFQNMNLMVTAEGVETSEHDQFARVCGCSRIQGFRYARPLPGELAEKYLGHSRADLLEKLEKA